MREHQTIFSIKELKGKIKNAFINSIPKKENKIQIIENWQQSIYSGKVVNSKEEEIKPLFLTQLFGDVLGYEYNISENWNLRLENKTDYDSSKADAALGFFKFIDNQELNNDVRAVIEIKDAKTTLDKPQNRPEFKGSAVEQCFMYAPKSGEKCKWVIVSNFLEIRLYLANDMTKYERFEILNLNEDFEFARFYYLLSKGQLFNENSASLIDVFVANRIEKEKTITNEFYFEYRYLREVFLQHLKLHNPNHNPLDLLQYAQTIIDRIIFVSVIKDFGLIQYSVLKELEDIASKSWDRKKEDLWHQLKKFFDALNFGFPPRINKLNGGLFKQNENIDNLVIKDVFLKQLLTLGKYDFESDLNINILGHIFEQSITDLENLKKDIAENRQVEYSETEDEIDYKIQPLELNKRKKDGIYYTPENITKYIVNNTIGTWLRDRRNEIGLNDLNDIPRNDSERNQHIELWEKYENILKNVKILDPSCGSGAFLTQAFDFLLKEWLIVSDVLQNLRNEKIPQKGKGLFNNLSSSNNREISKIKKDIVNYNLFGVDLNYESVEITKLGLWLKSASKDDSLAMLDQNIKCGNSLITDPNLTEKAFNWEDEFVHLYNPDIILKEKIPEYQNKLLQLNSEFEMLEKKRILTGFNHSPELKNRYENVVSEKNSLEYDIKVLQNCLLNDYSDFSGFDIIIGNPPYVDSKNLKQYSDYFSKNYSTYNGTADLYVYFYELSLNRLNKNGILGFISSNKFMKTGYGEGLRKLLSQKNILEIIDFTDYKVFQDALVASSIIIVKKQAQNEKIKISFVNEKLNNYSLLEEFISENHFFTKSSNLNEKIWFLSAIGKIPVKQKIEENSVKLKDIAGVSIYRGVTTGFNDAFIIDEDTKKQLVKADFKNSEIIKPLLQGRNIRKWYYKNSGKYMILTYFDINIPVEYKKIFNHLKRYEKELLARADKGKNWWNLRACKYYNEFENPKIIWGLTADKWAYCYDDKNHFLPSNGYILTSSNKLNIKYILGVLNSKLMRFYFDFIGIMTAGGAFTLKYDTVAEFPFKEISESKQEPIVKLVDEIIEIQKNTEFIKEKFSNRLITNLDNIKINQKLEIFYTYDFKTFINLLKKQNIKLSLNEQDEFEEYFNKQKDSINRNNENLDKLENDLNKLVYEIYNLSKVEIDIIENANIN